MSKTNTMMTFYEAAVEILRSAARPLHFKKITELAERRSLIASDSNAKDLNVALKNAADSPEYPISLLRPGIYSLTETNAQAPAIKQSAPKVTEQTTPKAAPQKAAHNTLEEATSQESKSASKMPQVQSKSPIQDGDSLILDPPPQRRRRRERRKSLATESTLTPTQNGRSKTSNNSPPVLTTAALYSEMITAYDEDIAAQEKEELENPTPPKQTETTHPTRTRQAARQPQTSNTPQRKQRRRGRNEISGSSRSNTNNTPAPSEPSKQTAPKQKPREGHRRAPVQENTVSQDTSRATTPKSSSQPLEMNIQTILRGDKGQNSETEFSGVLQKHTTQLLSTHLEALSNKALRKLMVALLKRQGVEIVSVDPLEKGGTVIITKDPALLGGGLVAMQLCTGPSLGAKDVFSLRASLQRHHARRGVMVSLQGAGSDAQKEGQLPKFTPIAIIDSTQLAALMIQSGVGVKQFTVPVTVIDQQLFAEFAR